MSKSFEDENNWDRCFLSEGDRYFIAEERGRIFREINRTLPAEDASELNRQGYALYEQGRCKEAVPFFQDAIAKDPRFIVARYNLLCSAGIILGRRSGSQWDEEQKHFDIMGWEQIEAIRQMDIGFLIERKDDPDLAYFRHSMRFYRIIGWYDEPFIKIGKILGTVRYCSLPGLYGPLEIYDFAIDGGFEYTGHSKDTGIKKEMHNGSYELYRENGQLYILLTDPWSETGGKIKGLFRQDGIIETPRGNLIPNYENRGGA